jgi:hypothetical protein
MSSCSPAEFGAALDGLTNDRPALQQAIDTAHKSGGGTVVIPAGQTCLSGTIVLKSRVSLHLEPGSRLVASVDPYDHRGDAFVAAFHAEDVSITGPGEIYGRGAAFIGAGGAHGIGPTGWRPRLLAFEDCTRVRLLNATLRDSAAAAVALNGCSDVAIRGISILNNLAHSGSDGLCIDRSRALRISDCQIESGGDCIVVRASPGQAQYGACEDVVVHDCILSTSSAGLCIGPETSGDIRNIVFSDSIIRRCHRGLAILLRDSGNIENVFAHHVIIRSQLAAPEWRGAAEPVFISARPRLEHARIGRIRHVRIATIAARCEGGVFIEGAEAFPVEDVRLDGVTLEIAHAAQWTARRDVRPPDDRAVGDCTLAAFHVVDADNVALCDCSVRWDPNPPACHGPAMRTARVERLRVENFSGHDAHFGERKVQGGLAGLVSQRGRVVMKTL